MTTNFQFPSILIPHIWDNITKERIISVFEKLQIADVARVDMIPRDNSTSFMAFIHMNYWYNNTAAKNLRNKIVQGEEGRVVYDDPWHWVVVMAKNPRLNLINEVSSYKTDISTNEDANNDPRVQQVKRNVTLLANQTEAQGKMIRYLRNDLFQADSHIFDLEQRIDELEYENIQTSEELSKSIEEKQITPTLTGEALHNRAIQWASGHFLVNQIPLQLIEAEEGEYISHNINGEVYTDKFNFIEKNCCEMWSWARNHPVDLYDDHICILADTFKSACYEFIGKTYGSESVEDSVEKSYPTNQTVKKVHFANLKTDFSKASSPSKLPTPTATSHSVDNLTIKTDINISDDEIDDGDIDCGDFSEMASRQVSKEIELLRSQRSGQHIMSHI